MDRRKIIGVAVFSAAIAGGGVAGVILGSPASGSAATPGPTTSTPSPGPFGMGHHDGAKGFGRLRGRGGKFGLDAAAKAIGVSTDTLVQDLKNGQTIAQVAKSKNVPTATVVSAMVASAKTQIDAQVTAKHLTTDQAAKIESHLTETITNVVNGTFKRPDAPKGANGPHRGFGFRGGFGLDAAAKAIGVSTDTLLQDLKNGQTIAQVAKSKNVPTATVISAMVTAAKANFAAAVKAGHLSADMATKIEANLTQMITNQVNGTFKRPPMPGGPGGRGWPGMPNHSGFGHDGGRPETPGATSSSAPTV